MSKLRKSLLRAAVGLALLAGLVFFAHPEALLRQLAEADPWWLLGGLLMAIASNAVSAWRWRALAQWLGADMALAAAGRWYFQAIGLNALLPGAVVGGDVYRALALARSGQGRAASNYSVLLDRISGLWMLCAMGGLGAAACAGELASWLHLAPGLLAALAALASLAWLLLPFALLLGLRRRWLSLPGRWFAPLEALAQGEDFVQRLLLQAVASALVQILSAAALACGAMALGVFLAPAAWAFAMAPIFLMAALPVSVGGWGTREAAAALALAPFGVSAAAAVGVGLIYGLYALAQGMLGALAFGMPTRERT